MSPAPNARRLKPPRRGDVLASALAVIGTVVYVVGLASFVASGLVRVGEIGGALLTLNVLSFLLGAFAFGWTFLRDLPWLQREEKDIQFVLEEGAVDPNVLDRVLLPEQARRRGAKPRREGGEEGDERKVETLLDDWSAQVQQVELGGADDRRLPTPAELRGLAVSRSAWLGSIARYVSQLLLLLTVLGTFIGVKGALPHLVAALQGIGGSGAALAPAVLAGALNSVAAAFGANLVALLGAIALGVAAFGMGVGRQSMLARLEHVGVQYIYPRLDRASAESTLAQAVVQLGDASRSMESLGELTPMLERLETAIGDMSTRLRKSLQRVLREQRGAVLEETRHTVDKLEHQITDVVMSVQQATQLYGMITGPLVERGETLNQAVLALNGAVDEIGGARVEYGQYLEETTRKVHAQLAQLDQTFISVRSSVDGSAEAAASIGHRIEESHQRLVELVGQAAEVAVLIREGEKRHREVLATIEEQLGDSLGRRLGEPIAALRDQIDSVPARVQQGVVQAFREVRGQGQGVGADDLSSSIDRLSLAVQQLETRISQPIWVRFWDTIRSPDGNRRPPVPR